MLTILKSQIPRSYKRFVKRILNNILDSILYQYPRKRLLAGKIHHVVFICKGNICRSAFAEHYMKTSVLEGVVRFDSCGLDVDQGNASPLEAVKVGREFGVELSVHQSKGIDACDLLEADIIVPMEYRQYLRLIVMFPNGRGKIRLLRDFAPLPERYMCNIYDPFGLGEDEFRLCFRKMSDALNGLRKFLGTNENERGI